MAPESYEAAAAATVQAPPCSSGAARLGNAEPKAGVGQASCAWPYRTREAQERARSTRQVPAPFPRTARRPRACPCLPLCVAIHCLVLLHARDAGLLALSRLPGWRAPWPMGAYVGSEVVGWRSGGQRRPLAGCRNQLLRSVTAVSQVRRRGSGHHQIVFYVINR